MRGKGKGGEGKGERMWRGPESGLPGARAGSRRAWAPYKNWSLGGQWGPGFYGVSEAQFADFAVLLRYFVDNSS